MGEKIKCPVCLSSRITDVACMPTFDSKTCVDCGTSWNECRRASPWRPVSEEPPMHGRYPVMLTSGSWVIGTFATDGRWYDQARTHELTKYVTHWMEIPPCP